MKDSQDPKAIRAGTSVLMTHKERQEFILKSELGKLLGWTK
jgi:hypothetical protein